MMRHTLVALYRCIQRIFKPHKVEKIYLAVPFSQKDTAKALGAKWDYAAKQWYILSTMDAGPFKQWYPVAPDTEETARSSYFYLVQSYINCYACKNSMLVHGIVLPEGFEGIDHETMEDMAENGEVIEHTLFCKKDYSSILSYVTYISPEALAAIHQITGINAYRKVFSKTTQHSYYRSVCPHCKAAQGDNFVICEFNVALSPVDSADYYKIRRTIILKEIKLCASRERFGYDPLDYMMY